ncbi:hypothetical protein MKX01_018385 [Papaver californicum]|nr:hypothetical protein MKX01_018385 [Papaver californicum]
MSAIDIPGDSVSAGISNITNMHEPANAEFFTIKADASFDYGTDEIGIGLVVFDTTWQCKGVKGCFAGKALDPEAAECIAVKEAHVRAKALNIGNIRIEADAKVVVNSITANTPQVRWESRRFLKEIKQFSSSFSFYQVLYVGKDNNALADTISKYCRKEKTAFEKYSNLNTRLSTILPSELHNVIPHYELTKFQLYQQKKLAFGMSDIGQSLEDSPMLKQGSTSSAIQMKVETNAENRLWATSMTRHMTDMNKYLQSRLLDLMQCRLLLTPRIDCPSSGKGKKPKVGTSPPLRVELVGKHFITSSASFFHAQR